MSILNLYILIVFISFGLFFLFRIITYDSCEFSVTFISSILLSFAISFLIFGHFIISSFVVITGESNIDEVRIVEGYHIDKIDLLHNYFEFEKNGELKRLPLFNAQKFSKNYKESSLYSYVTYEYFISYKLDFLTYKKSVIKHMIVNREDINSFNE